MVAAGTDHRVQPMLDHLGCHRRDVRHLAPLGLDLGHDAASPQILAALLALVGPVVLEARDLVGRQQLPLVTLVPRLATGRPAGRLILRAQLHVRRVTRRRSRRVLRVLLRARLRRLQLRLQLRNARHQLRDQLAQRRVLRQRLIERIGGVRAQRGRHVATMIPRSRVSTSRIKLRPPAAKRGRPEPLLDPLNGYGAGSPRRRERRARKPRA